MRAIFTIFCLAISTLTGTTIALESPTGEKSVENNNPTSPYDHLNAKGKKIGHDPIHARCVLDKNTGLVWELKTDNDSAHGKKKDYRWGGVGAEKTGVGFFDDWDILLKTTNKEKRCGFKDWRVPSIEELKSLVITNPQGLTINTHYFIDALDSPYWSSSAYANYPEHAQTVHFGNGNSYYYNGYRGNRLPVRLVRGKSAD